jgi:hypothetical protein
MLAANDGSYPTYTMISLRGSNRASRCGVSDRRLGYREFIAIGLRGCTGGSAQAIRVQAANSLPS